VHRPDGACAGAIVASYRSHAILAAFQGTEVGNDGMVALVAPADSRVRAYWAPLSLDPKTNIAASPMIKAMLADASDHWLVSRRPISSRAARLRRLASLAAMPR
jgi:hypothetical protein